MSEGSRLRRKVIDRHQYAPHYMMILANALSAGASRLYQRHFDLGLNEGRILAVLGHQPEKTALEIGHATAMNKSIVSRSLRALLDRKLVEPSGQGRGARFRLTDAGIAVHDAIVAMTFDREELLLAGIDPAERHLLVRLLARMVANIEPMNAYAPDAPDTGATA